MIRFKEIWDLYQKGKIEEESPLTRSSLPKLTSKHGERITAIIDRLVTLDTSQVHRRISAIEPKNPDAGSLESMLEEVEKAEQIVRDNISLDIQDNYVYSHAIRVIKLGDDYDQVLLESFQHVWTSFNTAMERLKQVEGVVEVSSARQTCDASYLKTKNVLRLAARRKLTDEIDSESYHRLIGYGRLFEIIYNIKAEIENLYQRYGSLDFCSDVIKELGSIRKKTKDKWYSKSPLAKACIDVCFIEGISKLDELQKEVVYATENLEGIQQTIKMFASLN